VEHTSYEAPHYVVVFSCLTPLSPAYINTFSSVPWSQTSSIYNLHLERDQVSHPYKTKDKSIAVFREDTGRQNILN